MRRNTVALFAGTVIRLLLMAEEGSVLAGPGRVFNYRLPPLNLLPSTLVSV